MGQHRPPARDNDGLAPFLIRYRHDGVDWTLELWARDADDARTRMQGLADARLAIDEDAAAAGPFAAVAALLRGGLSRLFAVNF